MFRKKGFWVLLVITLIVAGVGGTYYFTRVYAVTDATDEKTVQTAVVRRGEIVISASGAGTVIPASQVDLAFQGNGVLTELLVEIGDRVQTGDALARLDDTDARKTLISAQLQLLQAEENLAALLDTSSAEQNLALANANLAVAQLRLGELLDWAPDEQTVAQAQAALEAAQADYDTTQSRSAYDQTTSPRISLEQAQQNLQDAQAAYDTAWDPARDWELNDPRTASRLESEREATTRNLEKAQQNLELAQANYNLAWANISPSDELNAWNKVLSAQSALEAAQTGPTESEILSAQVQVIQAEISLAQAENALDVGIEQAELTVEQARLNLEAAQQALDATTLVAPIDGTVMSLAASVGEMVGSGTLTTLADLQQPSIAVYLDETDLNSVGVGFEAEVIFDALPDEVFYGQIDQVDPGLATVSGVSMVRAVVRLDASSYAKPQVLPTGANASVDVIGGRTQNALLVPVEALNEYATGEYAVFVMTNNEPVFTPVQVGLMDYSFAEIISGVQQGDVVTTGIVEIE